MAFSKVPSTFFGSGYYKSRYREPVTIDPATDRVSFVGNTHFTGDYVAGTPVFFGLVSATSSITGISMNTVYYLRDIVETYSGTWVGYPETLVNITAKLAATPGGAAIGIGGTSDSFVLSLLPSISFIADSSHLSPTVTGASALALLPSLTAAHADVTTGDYRYILQALYTDLQALFTALPTANKPAAVRMDTEQYQQGLTGVVTQALRTEFDFNASLTTLTIEP
jgi:hypothetical protein